MSQYAQFNVKDLTRNKSDINLNKKSNFINEYSSFQPNDVQIGYYNPYDKHYLSYKQNNYQYQQQKQPQPVKLPKIPQNTNPVKKQQPKQYPNNSFAQPQQQIPYYQQQIPQYIPQQQIHPQDIQRLQELERANQILRFRLENSHQNPQQDILSFITNKVGFQGNGFPQQHGLNHHRKQQPIVIIDDGPQPRRRSPPRERIIYQQAPPQYIIQKGSSDDVVIREVKHKVKKNKKHKKNKDSDEEFEEDSNETESKGGSFSDLSSIKSGNTRRSFKSRRSVKSKPKTAKTAKQSIKNTTVQEEDLPFIEFKILNLNNYTGSQNIVVRHALTNDDDFLNDLHDVACSAQDNIKGKKGSGKQIKLNYEKQYFIDYEDIESEIDDDQIIMLFLSFYEESTQNSKLIGWMIVPLFQEVQENVFKLHEGNFKQNLYEAPLQKPPFLEQKKINQNIVEYQIYSKNSDKKNLPNIDLTEQILADNFNNISIQILKLTNINTKGLLKFQIEINDPEENILDRKGNMCLSQGNLRYNRNGSVLTVAHETIFKIGENYLRNNIDPLTRIDHIISINVFDASNNPVGYVDIPLFKSKTEINLGTFVEEIQDPPDDSGKNPTMEVKIQEEKAIDIDQKNYDQNKGLLVMVYKINNYKLKDNVSMEVEIISNNQIIDDMDGNEARYESQDVFEPDTKEKIMRIKEGCELVINWKLIRDLCQQKDEKLQKMGILIKFIKEDEKADIGDEQIICWTIHPFFKQKLLNKGKFYNIPLYNGPCVRQFPINTHQVKLSNMTLDYQVGTCRLDDSFIGEVISSGDSLSVGSQANLEKFQVEINYLDDEKNELKVNKLFAGLKIVNKKLIINDDNNKPIDKLSVHALNKKGNKYNFQSEFIIDLNVQNLQDQGLDLNDYYLIVVFNKDKKKTVAWAFQQVLKNLALKTGQYTKQLYLGDVALDKLKNPEKLKKSTLASVNYTIQHIQNN